MPTGTRKGVKVLTQRRLLHGQMFPVLMSCLHSCKNEGITAILRSFAFLKTFLLWINLTLYLKHPGMQNGERGLVRFSYTEQSPPQMALNWKQGELVGLLISVWRRWLTQPSFVFSHLRDTQTILATLVYMKTFLFLFFKDKTVGK